MRAMRMVNFFPCKWSNVRGRREGWSWWKGRGEENGTKVRERWR